MLRKIFKPLIRHTREFGCLERRSEGGEVGGGGEGGRGDGPPPMQAIKVCSKHKGYAF